MQLEKTPEFNDAVELLCNSNKHLFITGSAGTGKSTLLEYCRQHSSKNLVVVAPTGVAALNVQGQTIHRFFGFPINVTPEKIKNSEIQPPAGGVSDLRGLRRGGRPGQSPVRESGPDPAGRDAAQDERLRRVPPPAGQGGQRAGHHPHRPGGGGRQGPGPGDRGR